ncbi:MAG: sigma-54 dependent transcriptional regulator [Anaerolineaceae bacterium]
MSATILIVDDEDTARNNVAQFLNAKGYEVIEAATLAEARTCINRGSADIILLDVVLPDGYGPSLLEETAHMPNRPPIILITAYGVIDMAVEAMKSGAVDFLQKPLQFPQIEQAVQRAYELVSMRRELAHFREAEKEKTGFVVGNTPQMKAVLELSRRAAQASINVLISGETGTGKEVIARYIHQNGPRTNKPFVAINCAAIQGTMLETELFGHEAGAFTSADKRKNGLFEVADDGILFLDEISSMPLDLQAKLLRAIEERAIRRVGGTVMIPVDVQIIAASNRDLPTMIREGKFREDLYYRLNVITVPLPRLSDRKEDIPELVGFFVKHFNSKMGKNILDVTPHAMERIVAYNWPGNIRQLSNAIEHAILFCDDVAIDVNHLPQEVITGVKP